MIRTKPCVQCKTERELAHFRLYRGVRIARCNMCRKENDVASMNRGNFVESSLNTACGAWKGRVNRHKNLTPII